MKIAKNKKTERVNIVVLSYASTGHEYDSGPIEDTLFDEEARQGLMYGNGDGHECDKCTSDGCEYSEDIIGLTGSIWSMTPEVYAAFSEGELIGQAALDSEELESYNTSSIVYADDSNYTDAERASVIGLDLEDSHSTHGLSKLEQAGLAVEECLGDFI